MTSRFESIVKKQNRFATRPAGSCAVATICVTRPVSATSAVTANQARVSFGMPRR